MTLVSGALRIAALSLTLTLFAARALSGTLPEPPTGEDSFEAGILHVDRFGSGSQTLILIPGLGCGAWVWSSTVARLSHEYTIYVITLSGFNLFAAGRTRVQAVLALADRSVLPVAALGAIRRFGPSSGFVETA